MDKRGIVFQEKGNDNIDYKFMLVKACGDFQEKREKIFDVMFREAGNKKSRRRYMMRFRVMGGRKKEDKRVLRSSTTAFLRKTKRLITSSSLVVSDGDKCVDRCLTIAICTDSNV